MWFSASEGIDGEEKDGLDKFATEMGLLKLCLRLLDETSTDSEVIADVVDSLKL